MPDNKEIEESPLSRTVTHDGCTIRIDIFKLTEDEKWLLEVIDQKDTSTVWDEQFSTEEDALNEAMKAITTEGVGNVN